MKLAFFDRPKQLKPAWSHSVSGTLWRLLVSSQGHLVGEVRDRERKTATFFCLNGETGARLWTDLALEEPWWVGMEEVSGDTLVLHGYDKPDMPMHRGMWMVGLQDGRVRWRNAELEYWFSHEGRVYGIRQGVEGRSVVALDLSSGEMLKEEAMDADRMSQLRRVAEERQRRQNLLFPVPWNGGDSGGALLAHWQELEGEIPPPMTAETLRLGSYFLAAYYFVPPAAVAGRGMDARFAILDGQHNHVVFRDTLYHEVDAPSSDLYFANPPMVYFVKEYSTLQAIRLPMA